MKRNIYNSYKNFNLSNCLTCKHADFVSSDVEITAARLTNGEINFHCRNPTLDNGIQPTSIHKFYEPAKPDSCYLYKHLVLSSNSS